MKSDCAKNPTSSISHIFLHAMNSNTTFLRHYKKLDQKFATPDECYRFHVKLHETQLRTKIQQKYDSDEDSILGTYMRINPTLQSPKLYRDISCHENDRRIITKYRVGSHELKIQSGRLAGSDRQDRICDSANGIQTVHHVLFSCA